jgi:phosphoribosylformylglycinamidine cyclo-ligase
MPQSIVATMRDLIRDSITYRDAGVDIDSADRLVAHIKALARNTNRAEVLAGIGGFGALFDISKRYRNPVLVSSTDGVGTKLKLAFQTARHDTVGIDLVAMSVNDILVSGAEPLFFLDYFACGKLDLVIAKQVLSGIARGCEEAGCALIGGETAEMPGMYEGSEYDLAGFAVGVAERNKIIDGSRVREKDVVLGLASSGAHSNGYSLIRKILTTREISLSSEFEGRPLSEALLVPTRIYVKSVLALLPKIPVKAMAHITGGGLLENLPRVVPDSLTAVMEQAAWPRPALFKWLQAQGPVPDHEMYRTFNCGIGMTLILSPEYAEAAETQLSSTGETVYRIGYIRRRQGSEPKTIVE